MTDYVGLATSVWAKACKTGEPKTWSWTAYDTSHHGWYLEHHIHRVALETPTEIPLATTLDLTDMVVEVDKIEFFRELQPGYTRSPEEPQRYRVYVTHNKVEYNIGGMTIDRA